MVQEILSLREWWLKSDLRNVPIQCQVVLFHYADFSELQPNQSSAAQLLNIIKSWLLPAV